MATYKHIIVPDNISTKQIRSRIHLIFRKLLFSGEQKETPSAILEMNNNSW